jgi:glucose-1-phosphate cytidylyltransferase
MKVVILAGGFGTRLSEETTLKPKPIVEIGPMPIIWHIMKIYSSYGFNDFVVCLGYKGYMIKEYFANYMLHHSDVTIDVKNNQMTMHKNTAEDWKITLVDTGLNSMTGGRIKRVKQYINNEPFMLTYGDGVSDVNIKELVDFHKSHGKKLTVTSVIPSGRFGALNIDADNLVLGFEEKPRGDQGLINGGFFVCEPDVLDYIEGDSTTWEREPMETLAKEHQMVAFKHDGYWQCMDTVRDRQLLESEWNSNKAKWKVW